MLDFEGGFHNTSMRVITRGPVRHNSFSWIVGGIDYTLTNRKLMTRRGRCLIQRSEYSECPQGGEFSLLLKTLAVDELLKGISDIGC